MTLTAYRPDPKYHPNHKIDLKQFRAQLGPDVPATGADLTPKLKCSKCGGRKVGLIYSPLTRAART